MSKDYFDIENITAIRGATTSDGNTLKEIENSVVELIDELILRNSLDPVSYTHLTLPTNREV